MYTFGELHTLCFMHCIQHSDSEIVTGIKLFFILSSMFLNPNNLNSNCSNLLDMRNLEEKVKNAFCYQTLFWPFTVRINCSSDLKIFANSRPSVLSFKIFSQSLEQFFLTVGENNFGHKIPFLPKVFKQQLSKVVWSTAILCLLFWIWQPFNL